MLFIFAYFVLVLCNFGTNFAFEYDATLAFCAGPKNSFWGKIAKKIDGIEMPEELICELSRTDTLINEALIDGHKIEHQSVQLKNEVDKLRKNDQQMFSMMKKLNEKKNELKNNLIDNHQQINSQQISAINSSVFQLMDKMATKLGIKLSDVKTVKFGNQREIFKSVLNLLKTFNHSKNDILSNNAKIENVFGLAKTLLEQSKSATLKGQRRRAKRAIDLNLLIGLIIGGLCLAICLVVVVMCRAKECLTRSNPN